MVKSFPHPTLGSVKLGRRQPRVSCPHLHLRNYMLRHLAPPPVEVDYSPAAIDALHNMALNDMLGDCVIAWMAHCEAVLTGASNGTPKMLSNDQIIATYSAVGGYVPGDDSTDQGCDELTALNYWRHVGLPQGSEIAGYISVDATDWVEVQTALWLFGNLMMGIGLPDEWVTTQMPHSDRFIWDFAGDPDPKNGHCPGAMGYSPAGVKTSTWGMLGTITPRALAAYATAAAGGSLYTVLSPDWFNRVTAKAPNGFDVTQLSADLQAIAPSPGPQVYNVPSSRP